MIVGMGIDLVELERIEKIHSRFGIRFLEKIFSPNELRIFASTSCAFLAGRFAAKEAAVKALGTGFSHGIGPRQIEVLPLTSGAPSINLLDAAKERAQTLAVRSCWLSISHERGNAVALVIMES